MASAARRHDSLTRPTRSGRRRRGARVGTAPRPRRTAGPATRPRPAPPPGPGRAGCVAGCGGPHRRTRRRPAAAGTARSSRYWRPRSTTGYWTSGGNPPSTSATRTRDSIGDSERRSESLRASVHVRPAVATEVAMAQSTDGVEVDAAVVREGVDGDHALGEARRPASQVVSRSFRSRDCTTGRDRHRLDEVEVVAVHPQPVTAVAMRHEHVSRFVRRRAGRPPPLRGRVAGHGTVTGDEQTGGAGPKRQVGLQVGRRVDVREETAEPRTAQQATGQQSRWPPPWIRETAR